MKIMNSVKPDNHILSHNLKQEKGQITDFSLIIYILHYSIPSLNVCLNSKLTPHLIFFFSFLYPLLQVKIPNQATVEANNPFFLTPLFLLLPHSLLQLYPKVC